MAHCACSYTVGVHKHASNCPANPANAKPSTLEMANRLLTDINKMREDVRWFCETLDAKMRDANVKEEDVESNLVDANHAMGIALQEFSYLASSLRVTDEAAIKYAAWEDNWPSLR